jgi:50S ribosomal protein L16 3-hydroxylase
MDWRPQEPVGVAQLREELADDAPLVRNPASRFSFVRQEADSVLLFVDGQCFECAGETAAFAMQLCGQDRVSVDPALLRSDPAIELIEKLFNLGSVAFDLQD